MDSSILFSLRLSLQVASIATFFVILIGVSVAYLFARKDFKGKEFLDIIFTLPLVLPPTVTGYYLIVIFGRNGIVGKFIMSGQAGRLCSHGMLLCSLLL